MCARVCECVHIQSLAHTYLKPRLTRSTNKLKICRRKKGGHLMMIIIIVDTVVVVVVAITISSSSSFHHELFFCSHRLFLLLLLPCAFYISLLLLFHVCVCAAVNKNCSSHKTYYLIFSDGARQMNELIPQTGFLLLLLLSLLRLCCCHFCFRSAVNFTTFHINFQPSWGHLNVC